MLTTRVALSRYHAGQQRMSDESRRFNVGACGRRFGKTKKAKRKSAETLLAGDPVGWFAPTYKVLLEAWDELVATLAPVTKRSNATDRTIRLVTGGVLEFWTLEDPDAGRSRKYKRVIIDEAGMCASLGEAWNSAIRPTLADLRGDAWFMGTPKGRNFFWEVFQRGGSDEWADWMSWQMPTSANPYIDPAEIEDMRREMPERKFQQEVLAQFLDDAGGVFRGVRARATLAPQAPTGGQYVMGVDWGKSNDYTVISVIDVQARKQVALDRFNMIDYAVQRGRLQALTQIWRPVTILAEANSIGTPIIEQLQRDGLPVQPFTTSNASKAQIIEGLALAFERAQIDLIDDATQTMELESYEMARTATGMPKYGAPSGLHDDTVIALALSYHAAYGYGEFGL
jgi:hypothetical protein